MRLTKLAAIAVLACGLFCFGCNASTNIVKEEYKEVAIDLYNTKTGFFETFPIKIPIDMPDFVNDDDYPKYVVIVSSSILDLIACIPGYVDCKYSYSLWLDVPKLEVFALQKYTEDGNQFWVYDSNGIPIPVSDDIFVDVLVKRSGGEIQRDKKSL